MPSSTEPRTGAGNAGYAWAALAAVLALGAVAVTGVSPGAIDWQPGLAWREPWRAWTAAWLHLSQLHLAANLAGSAAVGALGFVARVPLRIVAAWFVAWPLTQFGLLARPDIVHYGGLSGVLHAGAAAVALHLVVAAPGARRWVGVAVLSGLALKVMAETPWGEVLRQPAGWDIAVVPFAHASGLAAGLLAAAVAEAIGSRPLTMHHDD